MKKYQDKINLKKEQGSFRSLRNIDEIRKQMQQSANGFVNLSSNDYLGLATDLELRKEFLSQLTPEMLRFSSSSSRLLTGNTEEYEIFEKELAQAYHAEAALLFGSGYHANSGIIPAITDEHTLILADKLIHASMIDGIRLSSARFVRYRHNDYAHLEHLIEINHQQYESILIATESIFSMDGDEADLGTLIRLKKKYPNVELYIDEAHAVGLRGKNGLGCCEEQHCIADIDYLIGTFGKALASTGAFLICSAEVRDFLINTVRPFIFTTALPPVNISWSRFIFSHLPDFEKRRIHLRHISGLLHSFLESSGRSNVSTSQIIPFIIGENNKTLEIAEQLQRKGFYVLPIRPPSVPEGTARLRISLSAEHSEQQILQLIEELKQIK